MNSSPPSTTTGRTASAADTLRSLSIDVVDGESASGYAIEGAAPSLAARPRSAQEVAETLRAAADSGLAVAPIGGMTRLDIGNAPDAYDLALDMRGVGEILAHNHADLTATVEAGATVASLQTAFALQGQFLAIDPPLPDRATIGGALAVGWSGPLTWQLWSPRDVVIGMSVAQADGAVTKSGGQVVKNVSGYDMSRLHVGALGTLGVIVEASFKLTPLPNRQASVIAGFDDDEDCLDASLEACGRYIVPLSLSTMHGGAASRVLGTGALGGTGAIGRAALAARVGGRANSVRRQVDDITALLRRHGGRDVATLPDDEGARLWRRIADYGRDDHTRPTASVRVSVLPNRIRRAAAALKSMPCPPGLSAEIITSPAQGFVGVHWRSDGQTASPEHVREGVERTLRAARDAGGSGVVEHAPMEVKRGMDVWGEPTPSVDLMRALKRQYDPKRLLNPGRFLGGI